MLKSKLNPKVGDQAGHPGSACSDLSPATFQLDDFWKVTVPLFSVTLSRKKLLISKCLHHEVVLKIACWISKVNFFVSLGLPLLGTDGASSSKHEREK